MPERGEMPDELNTNEPAPGTEKAPATWEDILGTLPETQKQLYDQHVASLKNSVQATRTERDTLAKQMKELASRAEKGSEAEKELEKLSRDLETANRRAQFAEDAVKPEIGCTNIKAAWLLAQAEDAFDKKGNPDWAIIKASAPELFMKPAQRGHAGAGTDSPPQTADMNAFIRRAAGK